MCSRGRGTNEISFSIGSPGENTKCVVPSDHGRFRRSDNVPPGAPPAPGLNLQGPAAVPTCVAPVFGLGQLCVQLFEARAVLLHRLVVEQQASMLSLPQAPGRSGKSSRAFWRIAGRCWLSQALAILSRPRLDVSHESPGPRLIAGPARSYVGCPAPFGRAQIPSIDRRLVAPGNCPWFINGRASMSSIVRSRAA